MEPDPKYRISANEEPLHQGEIISNVVQVLLMLDSIGSDSPGAVPKVHPFAIVLTQDCDLEQHVAKIEGGKRGTLPNILFCETTPVATLKESTDGFSWSRVRKNKVERYQCLEQVPADQDATGEGISALGIDFKRYFTLPTEEVLERIRRGESKRRAYLDSRYGLHLAMRFFYYQMRVGLPDDHSIP